MQIVDEKKINFDLIEDLLLTLLDNTQKSASIIAPNGDKGGGKDVDDGSVLIFLPGIGEIRALYQRLSISKIFGDKKRFLVLSMHSSISPKEQKRTFLRPKVVVIDTGLERSVRQNNRTSTPTLVTDWCSKASAKQRAGRVSFDSVYFWYIITYTVLIT
jgi:HrpA-like RNA helicase